MDFAVTSSGQRRAKQMSVSGEPGKVLGILHEHGALSIRELASIANMAPSAAKSNLRTLMRSGLVRKDEIQ